VLANSNDAESIDHGPVPARRYVVFHLLAGLGCCADLISKHLVFDWLGMPHESQGRVHWLWPQYVGLQTTLNQGGVFGMMQGKVGLLTVFSVLALAGILYWLFVAKAALDGWLTITMGVVSGGIVGNLYDRIGWWGIVVTGERIPAVRDWILLRYGQWSWPNFNIADCLLVTGAVLLVLQAFLLQSTDDKAEPSGASGE